VHLRLVERDEPTRALLRAAMTRYDGFIDYVILDGTADERAPGLLNESRGAPTLALLHDHPLHLRMKESSARLAPGGLAR
jgi:hypothetical protein